MAYGWLVLLVVIWTLGVTLALVLLRMASDQDRAARYSEKRLFPFSDVPITYLGPWRG